MSEHEDAARLYLLEQLIQRQVCIEELEETLQSTRVFLEALEKTLQSRDVHLAAVIRNHLRSTQGESPEREEA